MGQGEIFLEGLPSLGTAPWRRLGAAVQVKAVPLVTAEH